MTRTLTLPIEEAVAFEKVKRFLNSKASNSESTKKGYTIGLAHLQFFLKKTTAYNKYNIETILGPLEQREINVYDLLEEFVDYLRHRVDVYNGNTKLSERTIAFYIAGVNSYFTKYDVEISGKTLRDKVTMPRIPRRQKETLNQKKIRNILQACNNTRLRIFIMILASVGTRLKETLAIRNRDVNFEGGLPNKLHVIADNTKTKFERDAYISDEAFRELKKFVELKYNDKFENIKSNHPNDLVFSSWRTDKIQPSGIYGVLHKQFANLLRKIEMAQRKDGQGIQRRKISFHLFRDYVKSRSAIHVNSDFSEWMLGHAGSTYWNVDEDERKELYLKCMPSLTFLDYGTVESLNADYESKLKERDARIKRLEDNMDFIGGMFDLNMISFNKKPDELKHVSSKDFFQYAREFYRNKKLSKEK